MVPGGFGADVVDDAGDAGNFVDDACGDALEDVAGQANPVGGHGIFGFDDAHSDSKAVRAAVSHYADAAHGKQNGEGLPGFFVEAGAANFFDDDGIGLAQSG